MIGNKEDKAEKSDSQAMNAEQAADFAALQASASEAPPAPGEAVEVEVDLAKEISGLIAVITKIVEPMFPSLVLIYTEDVTQSAGAAIAGVCKKHDWLQGGMFGNYGEELACCVVVGPLLFASVKGIQGDIEAKKKKALELAKPENAHAIAPPAPAAGTVQNESAKTVTFGAVA